jgi:hypothetical protein
MAPANITAQMHLHPFRAFCSDEFVTAAAEFSSGFMLKDPVCFAMLERKPNSGGAALSCRIAAIHTRARPKNQSEKNSFG